MTVLPMTVLPEMTWPAAPLLFGNDVARGLYAALVDPERWRDVEDRFGAVGAGLLRQVDTELASVAGQFANVDLARILVTGWAKHRELRAAGERSLVDGTAVPVTLATHDVTLTQRPSVDVMLGERRLMTIDCEFSAVLTVEGLRVIVRGGALREVEAGECTITVSFAVEGVEIAKRKVTGHAVVQIPLGAGIALVS